MLVIATFIRNLCPCHNVGLFVFEFLMATAFGAVISWLLVFSSAQRKAVIDRFIKRIHR